ncbi:MAG: hypothetical protein WBS24_04220 [Terriglobales bacterium]
MRLGFVCLLLIVCLSLMGSIGCGGIQNTNRKTATSPTQPAPPTQDQTVFSNINNNNSGWGWCTSCAGGASQASSYWMAQFQSDPSRDGSSAEFYVSGTEPYSDVLFWNKLGAQNSATQFTWDFWVYLDQASLGAEALEYDMYQFADGVEYMFGSQCSYGAGYWDVWNQSTGHWVQTPLPCAKFSPETWHHIVWQYHRTSDQNMHFDSLTLDGVHHALNIVEPSGPLPSGWNDNVGVQWQLDTGASPIAFHEWIDNVTLTAAQ